MGQSFKTITTKKPWYQKPGTLAALALFVVLGAAGWFLLRGPEGTLLARTQAYDPVSPLCAYALGYRGIKDDATRDAFEKILASGPSDKPAPESVRRACAYALGRTRQAHCVLYLVDAVTKDPSVPVRCTACRALGTLGENQGYETLAAALGDPDASVREAAAVGCRTLGDKRAIDPLIDHLGDSVPSVRRACHDALVALTGTSFDGTDERASWKRWREGH